MLVFAKIFDPGPLIRTIRLSNLVRLQLLLNRITNGSFDRFTLDRLFQRLVDQGLIAAPTGFFLEVLDDRRIEKNIHALFRRRTSGQQFAALRALPQYQLAAGNIALSYGLVLNDFRNGFFVHGDQLYVGRLREYGSQLQP